MKVTFYWLIFSSLCFGSLQAAVNVFDSGSTGADGALRFYQSPPIDVGHEAMDYDINRQVMVLFGGNGTWEWDGSIWQRKQFATAPTNRKYAALVYDKDRQVMVLFGGEDNSGHVLNDTWEYDGATWTLKNPLQSPPARRFHAMAYHEARQVTVMAGGTDGTDLLDAWLWNGIDWTQTANIPLPSDSGMAYDELRQKVVYFGHSASGGTHALEWDGNTWRSEQIAGCCRLVSSKSAVLYHPQQQKVLLFMDFNRQVYLWDGTDLIERNDNAPSEVGNDPGAFDYQLNKVLILNRRDQREQPHSTATTWLGDLTNWTYPDFMGPLVLFDMNSKADGIWHYTSITVDANVTVEFIKNTNNTPVVWLASEDVTIRGVIDISGQDATEEIPGEGGPGGHRGGRRGIAFNQSGHFAGTDGEGLGGGLAGRNSGESGGHGAYSSTPGGVRDGIPYGNLLLRPLQGGSGGGGSASTNTANGINAGGGAGAILISTSKTMLITGHILAYGGLGSGSGGTGPQGSGGGIRLIANRIEAVTPGQFSPPNLDTLSPGSGYVRVEAFFIDSALTSRPQYSGSLPLATNHDTTETNIQITHIASQTITQPPSGDLNNPDAVFVASTPISIQLTAPQLPTGTVINLRITSQQNQVIMVQSTPTDASGQATATATIPAGIGSIQAFADHP